MAKTPSTPGADADSAYRKQDILERLSGTNINEKSMLATDYLNHFNEVVMLLEMISDMPDCLEELKAWRPKSYKEHFQGSVFSDRELAMEAYDHAPVKYRAQFETIIDCLDNVLLSAIGEAAAAIDDGEEDRLAAAVDAAMPGIQSHLDMASVIINGMAMPTDQSEIDKILESS